MANVFIRIRALYYHTGTPLVYAHNNLHTHAVNKYIIRMCACAIRIRTQDIPVCVLRASACVCVLAAVGSRGPYESSHGLRISCDAQECNAHIYSTSIIYYNNNNVQRLILYIRTRLSVIICIVCVFVYARMCVPEVSRDVLSFRTHKHSRRTVKTGRTCSDTADRTRNVLQRVLLFVFIDRRARP